MTTRLAVLPLPMLACVALLICPTPMPAPAQDFDHGFERLYELGLPDPAGGEYVHLDMSRGSLRSMPLGQLLERLQLGLIYVFMLPESIPALHS